MAVGSCCRSHPRGRCGHWEPGLPIGDCVSVASVGGRGLALWDEEQALRRRRGRVRSPARPGSDDRERVDLYRQSRPLSAAPRGAGASLAAHSRQTGPSPDPRASGGATHRRQMPRRHRAQIRMRPGQVTCKSPPQHPHVHGTIFGIASPSRASDGRSRPRKQHAPSHSSHFRHSSHFSHFPHGNRSSGSLVTLRTVRASRRSTPGRPTVPSQ